MNRQSAAKCYARSYNDVIFLMALKLVKNIYMTLRGQFKLPHIFCFDRQETLHFAIQLVPFLLSYE